MSKSIIQKVFDALELSIEANVNCELTPRQCREILDRDLSLVNACDSYTNSLIAANKQLAAKDAEIERIGALLDEAQATCKALGQTADNFGAEIARLRGDVKKALAFVQEEQNAWGASWRIQTVARILLDTLSEASDGQAH